MRGPAEKISRNAVSVYSQHLAMPHGIRYVIGYLRVLDRNGFERNVCSVGSLAGNVLLVIIGVTETSGESSNQTRRARCCNSDNGGGIHPATQEGPDRDVRAH